MCAISSCPESRACQSGQLPCESVTSMSTPLSHKISTTTGMCLCIACCSGVWLSRVLKAGQEGTFTFLSFGINGPFKIISIISCPADRDIYISWMRNLGQSWQTKPYLSCRTTKPTKWHVHPAKTQISLSICTCPSWSESLLGAQVILLVFSCGGSFYKLQLQLKYFPRRWNKKVKGQVYVLYCRINLRSIQCAVVEICHCAQCTYQCFPPKGGGEMAGILWGLDCQNSHCPREFDRRLWHRGGTLDVSARKSQRIWRHVQGILDTKLCHMGGELDSNFSKLSNSLG